MTAPATFTLILPMPPSVNNLFFSAGKKRVPSLTYTDWRKRAKDRLRTQRVKPILGPVSVHIVVKDTSRRDLDNCAKAILDFLVIHRLIKDDSRKYVRRIVLEWGEAEGATVTVSSIEVQTEAA